MTPSLNPREGMKVNRVKEEITMTAMETLMTIMMSCLALVAFLSWRMDKERLLYVEKLDAMTDELRRLHEDNIRLRDEVSKCYVESVCSYGKMCRDLNKLMYCVDELRWAINTSKAVNKDAAEHLRDPFFPEEEDDYGWTGPVETPDNPIEKDIIEGLKHDGVWDPEPDNHDKRSA